MDVCVCVCAKVRMREVNVRVSVNMQVQVGGKCVRGNRVEGEAEAATIKTKTDNNN